MLSPRCFELLSCLCNNLFEEGEGLEEIRGKRGALNGYRTTRTKREFSRDVIWTAQRSGFLDGTTVTEAGFLRFQEALRERSLEVA